MDKNNNNYTDINLRNKTIINNKIKEADFDVEDNNE